MATKKTTKAAPKGAGKKAPAKKKPAAKKTPAKKTAAKKTERAAKPAAPAVPAVSKHPLARLKAAHGTKDDLIKRLVEPLLKDGEDKDALKSRLSRSSNRQLLHLERVVETVKSKFGGRDQ